jgi:hypothetical protein
VSGILHHPPPCAAGGRIGWIACKADPVVLGRGQPLADDGGHVRYLLVAIVQLLLPAWLGLAGGAMPFLVVAELFRESLERCTPDDAAGRPRTVDGGGAGVSHSKTAEYSPMCSIALIIVVFACTVLMVLTWDRMAARRRRARDEMRRR